MKKLSQRLPVFTGFESVSDKRVLARVDFNVPIENNSIIDDYRIIRTLPLLRTLYEAGARLLLLGHLTEKKTHRSFMSLMDELTRITELPITFAESPNAALHQNDRVMLLENLRAFPGEEANNPQFAKELSLLGDLYINESFSQSHRPYASIVTLPSLLPSYVGPLFYEEVSKLEEVKDPERPFLLILGGVKFATKVGVLRQFMNTADTVFIGGAIANTFLAGNGYSVGASPVERNEITRVRELFLNKKQLVLPSDVRVDGGAVRQADSIGEHEIIYDIGPESSVALSRLAETAKTILWNGPMGFMERGYEQATIDLIDTLANVKAKVIIGGGDTMGFIRKRKLENAFYHLSTGGGAMLEFLAKGTLPGIEAMIKIS
jgi:phosphoglycerate kinase